MKKLASSKYDADIIQSLEAQVGRLRAEVSDLKYRSEMDRHLECLAIKEQANEIKLLNEAIEAVLSETAKTLIRNHVLKAKVRK